MAISRRKVSFALSTLMLLVACKRAGDRRTARDTGLVKLDAVSGELIDAERLIKAPAPQTSGWECFQQQKIVSRTRETLVQCWRRSSPEDFVLVLAKDYSVPPGDVLSAETLARGIYKRNNEEAFQDVHYTRQASVNHRGHPAFESELDAVHQEAGKIHKRELVMVAGSHVLLLDVEGNAAALSRQQRFADDWFARVDFGSLNQ
jgi:hypothetical protein